MTKRKSIGYIYMFTNRINGKKYIGQHEFKEGIDENYFGSGSIFANAKEKYGIENFKFDILCWCNSKEELDNAESYFIGFKYYTYANTGRGYNIADGGNGGNLLRGKTEEEMKEIRRKISEAIKGEKNPMYGRTGEKHPMYGRTREKKPMYGKNHTKKSREKMSEAKIGEKNPMYGKNHTKKSREKMSEAKIGEKNPMYGRTREKNPMYGRTGEKHPRARKVRCLEEEKVFNTLKEASEWCGLKSHMSITFCCQGKRKVAGGYHWEYVN